MPFSQWYADVVLPGRNAESVTPNWDDFSSDFQWGDEGLLDKISYYNTCDSSDNVINPPVDQVKNVVVNGAQEFEPHVRKQENLIPALYSPLQQSSMSASSTSSSLSSSSSSRSSSSCSSGCSLSSSSWSYSSSSSSRSSSSCSMSSSSSSSLGDFHWLGWITVVPGSGFGAPVAVYTDCAVLAPGPSIYTDWAIYSSTEGGPYTTVNDGCNTYSFPGSITFYYEKQYYGELCATPPLSLLIDQNLPYMAVYDFVNIEWNLYFKGAYSTESLMSWQYYTCCSVGQKCYFDVATYAVAGITPSAPDPLLINLCSCLLLNSYKIDSYVDGDIEACPSCNPSSLYSSVWDGTFYYTGSYVWEGNAQSMDGKLFGSYIPLLSFDVGSGIWTLEICCFESPSTQKIVWAGTKTTGTTPSGTYLKISGCGTPSALLVVDN